MFVHPEKDTVSDRIRETSKLYCDEEVIDRLLASDKSTYFLDIGANTGSCSFAAAALGKPVLSFEPNPINVALIK